MWRVPLCPILIGPAWDTMKASCSGSTPMRRGCASFRCARLLHLTVLESGLEGAVGKITWLWDCPWVLRWSCSWVFLDDDSCRMTAWLLGCWWIFVSLKMTGRRCEVGGTVSCRLNVSWVLPSHFTSFCTINFYCLNTHSSSMFVLVFLIGMPRRHQDTWSRSAPSRYQKDWNPLFLEVTRRWRCTQAGAAGTLAAPVPAARRTTRRLGKKPRKNLQIAPAELCGRDLTEYLSMISTERGEMSWRNCATLV